GQELGEVHHHVGEAGLTGTEHLAGAGYHDVAANHQLGRAGGNPDGVDVLRPLSDAHVAVDRAALLGEAGHVDDAYALALEVRRHAEHAADGDDAGAADAGDDDVVGEVDLRQARIGQYWNGSLGRATLAHGELGAMHGDERGAEAFDAGEVFIAARL